MVDESNLNEGKQGAIFALVALLHLMRWHGVQESETAVTRMLPITVMLRVTHDVV
jgi:hypothetical protein